MVRKEQRRRLYIPPELLDGGDGADGADAAAPSSLLVLAGGAVEPEGPRVLQRVGLVKRGGGIVAVARSAGIVDDLALLRLLLRRPILHRRRRLRRRCRHLPSSSDRSRIDSAPAECFLWPRRYGADVPNRDRVRTIYHTKI